MPQHSSQTNPYHVTLPDGRHYHPYGTQDPHALITRWLSPYLPLKPNTTYISCGYASGLHIDHFLKHLPKSSHLLLLEKDPQTLKPSNQLTLITSEDFSHLPDLSGNPPELLHFQPLSLLHEHFYAPLLKSLAAHLAQSHTYQKTAENDTSFWQATTLQNLPTLEHTPSINFIQSAYNNPPAIIVSAGPSLDLAYDFLQKAQQTALIICVNSAYRALRNNNITPHITIAADPRLSTALGYKNQPTSGTLLACPFIVHPSIPPLFKDATLTWSSNNHLASALINTQNLPQLQELGTVAASAIDLAHFLGATHITLVGQDLAFQSPSQSHASDSHYNDPSLHPTTPHTSLPITLQSNTHTSIYQDHKLHLYHKTLSNSITSLPHITFQNTAPHGAPIPRAPYTPFPQALQNIPKHPISQLHQTLFSKLKEESSLLRNKPSSFNKNLQNLQNFLNSTLNLTLGTYSATTLPNMESLFKKNPHNANALFQALPAHTLNAWENRTQLSPDILKTQLLAPIADSTHRLLTQIHTL